MKIKSVVRATDPCYEPYEWCGVTIENVLEGDWYADTKYSKDGRVAELSICHEDYSHVEIDEPYGNCGVDSGQCGFFNMDYYERNQHDDAWREGSWYWRVSQMTLNKPCWGVIDDEGVCSESGYGDGCYPLYVAVNDEGKVVGMKLVFID